jgi:DNA-binding phage protein
MSKGGSKRVKTSFELELDEQLRDPEFARQFEAARSEIASIDKATNAFLGALDKARIRRGLSKAELARRIGAEPAVMRRLLSAEGQNPTLATLLKIATALGMALELQDVEPARYHKAG